MMECSFGEFMFNLSIREKDLDLGFYGGVLRLMVLKRKRCLCRLLWVPGGCMRGLGRRKVDATVY